MNGKMKRTVLPMVVVGLVSGCATGIGGWLSPSQSVAVSEVRRGLHCGTDTDETRLTLLDSADAAQRWADQRGVQLSGEDRLAPTGRFVMVEMGARPSGGYGLAVSTAARQRGNQLMLQATFFTPTPDTLTTQAQTQPCVLVRLPESPVQGVRLYDQNGTLRAVADRAHASD